MTTITRIHHRHWSDSPEVDARVSRTEQEDRMPSVGGPSVWMVALLGTCLSFVIGMVLVVIFR